MLFAAGMEGTGDITQALRSWDCNRDAVLQQLMPAVYAELHKMAAGLMRKERPGNTLQPTVLINEVYLRLVRQDIASWQDRAHFFGIAARLMRQILVDHARQRCAGKRGGSERPVIDGEIPVGPGDLEALLDLDAALERMREWDERKVRALELHYFGGMTVEEISGALDLTLPTVRRDLLLGRAWLRDHFAH
ncbi:MAG TPA: ECF-type sigma factor [Bryobacteraceae bacterium]|nr:ECF-type sigma factor [Bryobacteraceae bacterium]